MTNRFLFKIVSMPALSCSMIVSDDLPVGKSRSQNGLSSPFGQMSGIARDLLSAEEKQDFVDLGFDFLRSQCTAADGFQGPIWKASDPNQKPIRIFRSHEVFSSLIIYDLMRKSDINGKVMHSLQAYISESPVEGHFNFFDSAKLREKFPADADCTAVGSSCIQMIASEAKLKHRPLPESFVYLSDIAQKIIENVVPDGLPNAGVIQVYFPPRGERENRLDPVVCANALHFLCLQGKDGHAKPTEDYLYNFLTDPDFQKGTRYYPSPTEFLYFMARLVSVSPRLAGRFQSLLENRLEALKGTSTNPLDLAMRVIVSRQFNKENDLEKYALMSFQKEDGGWPLDTFFTCGQSGYVFGSRSITTAFALNALDFGHDVELAETRDVLRNIKYPFDTFIQSSERVDSLTDFLNEFLTQNELFNSSKKERYVTLISSYVKNCSLPESSSDTLATTALLLAIYFCVNDKLKLSLVQDGPWIRQLSQLLTDDNREGYSPTPLNRAMMLFVDRLNLVPASQHIKAEFVTFLSKAFTAMLERSISSGTINSLDQYEINRSDDIFVRPYIALLRVLNNITLSPTFSSSSERLDMDNSVIRAIYISNDVFSLDRDIRSGADNYISIHSRITGDSLTQSEVKTLREHNKEVAVFSSQLEACVLKSGFLGPSERKYLQLLQISLTGNYLSMQECAFRYSVKA